MMRRGWAAVEAPAKGSMRGAALGGSALWTTSAKAGRGAGGAGGCIYEPWMLDLTVGPSLNGIDLVYGLAKLQSGSSGPLLPAPGQTAELDPEGCRQWREWRLLAFTKRKSSGLSRVGDQSG
jgi:hypothetical protein